MKGNFYTFNNSCPWYYEGICEAMENGKQISTACTSENCAPLFFIEKLFELGSEQGFNCFENEKINSQQS